ncbi:MAG: hypothetical protein NTX65_12150 [Ignavibacteriales bacterium]|nr:hypothetical protein [Ignavibacteriales bacterium]
MILKFLSKFKKDQAIYLLFISLIVTNFIVFAMSWGIKNFYYMGADEDQWIKYSLYYIGQQHAGSPIYHVPLFCDLIYPFISGIFVNMLTGYLVWKIIIYILASITLFLLLSRVSNIWIGFVLTTYFQYSINTYAIPTYSYLAMLFYLVSLLVIYSRTERSGIAFGLLLLGGLVRFEILIIALAFFICLLISSWKIIFSRKFAKQLIIPVLIFISLIYWHGSSITMLPNDLLHRGQTSVVWYMYDYLYYEGDFKKYTNADRGSITNEDINKVLMENFGKSRTELDNGSFFDLWKANPQLMMARYKKLISELPILLIDPFKLRIPFTELDQIHPLLCLLLTIIPALVILLFKFIKNVRISNFGWSLQYYIKSQKKYLPKEALILTCCVCFAFIPWMMTKPQAHYLIMALPAFYILLSIFLSKIFLSIQNIVRNDDMIKQDTLDEHPKDPLKNNINSSEEIVKKLRKSSTINKRTWVASVKHFMTNLGINYGLSKKDEKFIRIKKIIKLIRYILKSLEISYDNDNKNEKIILRKEITEILRHFGESHRMGNKSSAHNKKIFLPERICFIKHFFNRLTNYKLILILKKKIIGKEKGNNRIKSVTIFVGIILIAILIFVFNKKPTNTKTVIYNGKTYHTVEIGSQVWLKENLDIGEKIPGNKSAGNNGIIEKYCYDNKQENCDKYGGLYQWDEAMQYSKTPGTRGICPDGWHIPEFAELQTLSATVNNKGNALKLEGTNSDGFSALLAGYRYTNGYFNYDGKHTYFWSSSESGPRFAQNLGLNGNGNYINMFYDYKESGFSVRCVKD